VISHSLLKSSLEGDEKVKDWLDAIARHALDFPLPVLFPHMVSNITRLREPSLVTSFYALINSRSKNVQSGVLGTPESGHLNPMRAAILELFIILRSGVKLLQSSDFNQTDTVNRTALIKRIEGEMARSPAADLFDQLQRSEPADVTQNSRPEI
jgi:hypothetical protein